MLLSESPVLSEFPASLASRVFILLVASRWTLQKPFHHLCALFRAVRRGRGAELILLSLSAGKALASSEPPRCSMHQGFAAQPLPSSKEILSCCQRYSEMGTGDRLANRQLPVASGLAGVEGMKRSDVRKRISKYAVKQEKESCVQPGALGKTPSQVDCFVWFFFSCWLLSYPLSHLAGYPLASFQLA